jgi:branched-chain amino acid transport system substrate-binding protein
VNTRLNFKTATLILALIALAFSNCKQTPSNNTQGNTVRISANLPLSGDLATYGASVRDGAVMAVQALGSRDPNGPKLEFNWQDNAGDTKTAVTVMQQQYISAFDIYVSGITPQTMAIKDQVQAKGTPHFMFMFYPFIGNDIHNNFRTWVNYKVQAPTYLSYAKARNPKRIAIIYVQISSTVEQFNKLVIPGLKDQGIQDLLVEPFVPATTDFKDLAVKVRDFKPDLIILNGFQKHLVGIIRSLRPLNIITDGNTIATYDAMDAALLLGPDELEGIRVTVPTFVTQPDQQKIKEWRDQFRARYGREALYTNAFGYDMALIINDAAKRLHLPATSEQWINALRTTSTSGITGSLKFDEDGDLITAQDVGVFRNGKIVQDKPLARTVSGNSK